jgi:hypothetical protein
MNGYNLLISGDTQAWENNLYSFPIERFFEYTEECYIQQFKGTDDNISKKLMAYPALFLHEGFSGISKIGYITEIRTDGAFYRLTLDYKYTLDSKKLSEAEYDLGIGRGGTSRTYWAFKDVDISNVLRAHQLLSDDDLSALKIAIKISERRFDVAFSFPGEKREYVKNIVTQLKNIYSEIFYDEDFTEDLAVPGMDLVLTDIYKKQSKLVCVFLCNEYEKKKWCNLEWRAIREIIDEHKNESLMLFRFDDTEIRGVSSKDGYSDVNKHTENDIVNFIASRIQKMKVGT